ncbi:prenyltransferase/squalene oxidase repeat-containing protein [Solwaraspora sp. WMMD406]|uniref:prenyltransferase/squalene oxidase repeat-containing protein n=1 Tax=Solwaraspora sp. WMMD406 TaxID=3016095 RepID=UPI00241782DA|nr:prenyltransferase/squalene oxidase repeat-containing protein [Solwaraspora sp. WMMD406]MDG4766717.1 prenyltransferase/squalene oxidase repeat-containing protein [Solwaraspora sp. WMMD406]
MTVDEHAPERTVPGRAGTADRPPTSAADRPPTSAAAHTSVARRDRPADPHAAGPTAADLHAAGPHAGWSAAAQEVVDGLTRQPWGRSSVSVYETARLVSQAPWLPGHQERVRYLLGRQHPDGSWGPPGGYGLVPTLSATEALLAGGPMSADGTVPSTAYDEAALRGLAAVRRMLTPVLAVALPDTPAADIIVPALVAKVNRRLDRRRVVPSAPGRWTDQPPLSLPAGLDSRRLAAVRLLLGTGGRLPAKLLHALEVLTDEPGPVRVPTAAPGRPGPPAGPGTIGGSPAATAAWLGIVGTDHTGADEARAYLRTVVREYGGPVPCATPITVFERAWVLATMLRCDLPIRVPPEVVAGLRDAVTPTGAAAGAGLPADADTTGVVLHVLALLGEPADPTVLRGYQVDGHFATWPDEDGASVTTNAHVLDALGTVVATGAWGTVAGGSAYRRDHTDLAAARRSVTAWLCDRQQPDGCWSDRWHASPYYATAACALALHEHGTGPRSAAAVLRAVDWVLRTQRPDGSWGRWQGTTEETAYAVQVLLATTTPPSARMRDAALRGARHLRLSDVDRGPALWHDKDLYQPVSVVRATVIGAGELVWRMVTGGLNRHA